MSNSFYSAEELTQLGLGGYGENVLISRFVHIYNPEKVTIGNNVRIDDFCILSGNISLGSNIHIAAYCALYGANGITMEDYTGLSARSTIYSAMDDFSGNWLIGPIHPQDRTHVIGGQVHIKKFAQIGVNSVVFPCVIIEEGVVVGAMSMVKHSLPAWGIYAGIPVKFIAKREKKLLQYVY